MKINPSNISNNKETTSDEPAKNGNAQNHKTRKSMGKTANGTIG